MHSELLTYQADGLTLQSRLFVPPGGGRRPGVLVFPEAFGLGEHAIGRAERLAGMGYVALASDLHGDGLLVDGLEEAIGMLQPLFADPSRTRARAGAGLAALAARPEVDAGRIAAIGFCFGGTMALELARSGAEIKAVVGFHSGLGTAAPKTDAKAIKAKVLVCIGADDPFIPPEQRAGFEAEMRDGGVDWQMHLYGGTVHSFTNPEAAKRNKPEAVRLQRGGRCAVVGVDGGAVQGDAGRIAVRLGGWPQISSSRPSTRGWGSAWRGAGSDRGSGSFRSIRSCRHEPWRSGKAHRRWPAGRLSGSFRDVLSGSPVHSASGSRRSSRSSLRQRLTAPGPAGPGSRARR